eukprot:5954862-Pleurochrysis_carterae.AAC.1
MCRTIFRCAGPHGRAGGHQRRLERHGLARRHAQARGARGGGSATWPGRGDGFLGVGSGR